VSLYPSPDTTSGHADALSHLATGRTDSFFEADFQEFGLPALKSARGSRLLIVGGAGSIGSAVVSVLARFPFATMDIVDVNENGLADLIRDLRSASTIEAQDVRTFVFDFGGDLMRRFVAEQKPFDFVLNFAAVKHVRSEKDVFSLIHMLETNVSKHARFKEWLSRRSPATRYFAVSTDKAANPSSAMGASKRLMEQVLFSSLGGRLATSSARFANVAFSNGSLLRAFLDRMARQQPLAVPRDTRRYFVSHNEAAQICALAAVAVSPGYTLVPLLDAAAHLKLLSDIAFSVVESFGLQPVTFDDEDAARTAAPQLKSNGKYPVVLTPLDTAGEKPFEEFLGDGESAHPIDLRRLAAIDSATAAVDVPALKAFVEFVNSAANASTVVSKEECIARMNSLLPSFRHAASTSNLDQRM
jgi:FlaA1/EpsC-like NDP-sugar epimerase